jgi:hypothetical protein
MSAELESPGQHDRPRCFAAAPRREAVRPATTAIRHSSAVPPVEIPPGHIGPVVLPGTGRLVYWTGRVAIGLRHQPSPRAEAVPQSALWVQELMLGPGRAMGMV